MAGVQEYERQSLVQKLHDSVKQVSLNACNTFWLIRLI